MFQTKFTKFWRGKKTGSEKVQFLTPTIMPGHRGLRFFKRKIIFFVADFKNIFSSA